MNLEKRFGYDGKEALSLADWKTDDTAGWGDKKKAETDAEIAGDIEKLRVMQDKLYAQNKHAVLMVFQALDAAGKDSTISHVMSGINPQGCQVVSFKTPSAEDLSHDYLWRIHKNLPERGRIGIFNRSYYEEMLITRVHPELIINEKIPGIASVDDIKKSFWKSRYSEICNYEKYLTDNGFTILKFFLHLSKEEQKRRFLKRIELPEKNWKFSASDTQERALWDEYQTVFEEALAHTATKKNPWYIVPADNKWFMRLAVSKIINARMARLDLAYPAVSAEQQKALEHIKEQLLGE
ncbi:MAG: polyphosphate kinase 2 family protein [Oscillospiraceae bacterium]|nr:polyphosphate kinase 2 family protein [Oscillospiraceae bacterium]